jgi:hypothetical protein
MNHRGPAQYGHDKSEKSSLHFHRLTLFRASVPLRAHRLDPSNVRIENVQSVSETGFFRSSFTHPSMACQGSFLLQNAILNAFQAALILKS